MFVEIFMLWWGIGTARVDIKGDSRSGLYAPGRDVEEVIPGYQSPLAGRGCGGVAPLGKYLRQ